MLIWSVRIRTREFRVKVALCRLLDNRPQILGIKNTGLHYSCLEPPFHVLLGKHEVMEPPQSSCYEPGIVSPVKIALQKVKIQECKSKVYDNIESKRTDYQCMNCCRLGRIVTIPRNGISQTREFRSVDVLHCSSVLFPGLPRWGFLVPHCWFSSSSANGSFLFFTLVSKHTRAGITTDDDRISFNNHKQPQSVHFRTHTRTHSVANR